MRKCLSLHRLTALGLLWSASSIYATQTDNHGIHAVPPPGAVEIDGKLDDWDLSGKVLMCYDVESLIDTYSAEVAMMYDDTNLYVAIAWKDRTPMGNSHDPRYQANKGWAGDAVQLRLKTDRISHITAWYYAAKEEPALLIDYGRSLTEPFKGGSRQLIRTDGWKLSDGAEMAFLRSDGGCIQEIKIPWKLVTNEKAYKAGDRFNCGVELLWGETDWPSHRYADNLASGMTSREFFWTAHQNWGPVYLAESGNLKLPEPEWMKAQQQEALDGPAVISYDLPKAGRVTLAINDASGKRIRNLVPALPRQAGQNVEKWDGLDDSGKPVPPGEYLFVGLRHDGIHLNYVMSFANPGNPSWETSDNMGAFYGDHTNPQAAAAAGDYVALACPMGESGKHLIACDLSGQRLWGLHNRVAFDGGRISLATDGKILWVASEGKQSSIYRVDLATGKYSPWAAKAKDSEGREFDLLDLRVTGAAGMGASKEVGEKVGAHNAAPQASGPNLRAIAWHDGTLAACLTRDNKIKLLDAESGALRADVEVERPRAVVFDGKSGLIVLAGDHLVRMDSAGNATPFSSETFPDGYGLARDEAGNIYLSVRGSEHNVKVFGPDGKRIGEIGKKGGRPGHGAFIAEGMRNPAQIAVDSRNRLWVAEETGNPKRTSVWSMADGTLVKDFNGTTNYAGAGGINPDDPTMGFAEQTVWKLDLSAGTYRPVFSVGRRGDDKELFPPRVFGLKNRSFNRGGKTYVYTTGTASQGGNGAREVHCAVYDGKDWRGAASIGSVNAKKLPDKAGQLYAWNDGNGDGLVQDGELKFEALKLDGKPAAISSSYWGQLPGPDGTVVFMVNNKETTALARFPVKQFSPSGTPYYDISKPEIIRVANNMIRPGEGSIIAGGGGKVYLNQNPLLTVGKDGKVLGTYPSRNVSVHGSHNATSARPGYIIGPSSITGTIDLGSEIGEVFALNGNLGENYLFTQDALYIQSLFKDTRGAFDTPSKAEQGMPMDTTTAGGESFGGNFVRTKDGKVYLTMGTTDARVIEVTGLNSIQRFSGKFAYTPEQFAAAQAQSRVRIARQQGPKSYKVAKAAGPATIDGKPDEWPELLDDSAKVIEIQESKHKRFARVALRYDDRNLYAGYRVMSPSNGLKNAGQDYRLLFKTGDVVDLMFGPQSQPPNGAGNLRLVFSKLGEQPVAVLNEKKVQDAKAAEAYEFTSPWRSIRFDRVVLAPDTTVAIGSIKGGYFVEVAIPWQTLGVQPKSGLTVKADVGVLFGDKGGTTTIARHYWSNKATGLVNDVPGEADLTPEVWGELELE